MNAILSEGTGRYRRNTIIVAFVLLLIWFVPGTDFEGAGFFGIKIASSDRRAELLVVSVLLLILLYQFGLFLFYAYMEFSDWLNNLPVEPWGVGAIFGFGISPKRVVWRGYRLLTVDADLPNSIQFHLRNCDEQRGLQLVGMSQHEIVGARRGIVVFALIDLAIPTIVAEWAIILSVWTIVGLACRICVT